MSLASDAVYAVEKLIQRAAEKRKQQQQGGSDGEVEGEAAIPWRDERGILEMAEGDGTSAIEQIAATYGKQAVVVSIDPKRVYIDPPPPPPSPLPSSTFTTTTSSTAVSRTVRDRHLLLLDCPGVSSTII